jgi:ubiquinone/menaquinone biosynthesis C-methylase UbiE
MSSNDIYNQFHGYSDEEFLEILCRAETEPVINNVLMPGFPSEEFQIATIGDSGAKTLRKEGWRFTRLIKDYTTLFNKSIDENTKILDFGVGWGRIIRSFFHRIPSDNIFGIDVDPKMISICNETLHAGNYSVTTSHPPTNFSDNSFDIIFAYSVFSHLRYDVAEEWIIEFKRILKEGGVLVATTQGLHFLDYCENLKRNPDEQISGWQKAIANCFDTIEETREKYKRGVYLRADRGR